MEYINGDSLNDVRPDPSGKGKEDIANQVAEAMRTMRRSTAFDVTGGTSPDGSTRPLVDGVDVTSGWVSFHLDCDSAESEYRIGGCAPSWPLQYWTVSALIDQVDIHTGISDRYNSARIRSVNLGRSISLLESHVAQGGPVQLDAFIARPYPLCCGTPIDMGGMSSLAVRFPAVYVRLSTGILMVPTYSHSRRRVLSRLGRTAMTMGTCVKSKQRRVVPKS